MTAEENLAFWGGARGLGGRTLRQRVREALELTGLEAHARRQIKHFSGGVKRRLNFACGILHRPPVLLLDEPAAGVDPQSRVRLLELVRDQARAGVCVLYTTHQMEEAEASCDTAFNAGPRPLDCPRVRSPNRESWAAKATPCS